MAMQNASSNLTFFLKYCIPTMWVTFFGPLTIFLLTNEEASAMVAAGALSPFMIKVLMLSFFLSSTALLYIVVMRLKRVEFDAEFIYVTNYLKVFKYPHDAIKTMEVGQFLFFHPIRVIFHNPGYFGKRVTFLAGKSFIELVEKYPRLAEQTRDAQALK